MPEHEFKLTVESDHVWTADRIEELVRERLVGVLVTELSLITDEPDQPRSIVANGFEYDQNGREIRLACMSIKGVSPDDPPNAVCGGDIIEVETSTHNHGVADAWFKEIDGIRELDEVQWSLEEGHSERKHVCSTCGTTYNMPDGVTHTYGH